MSRDYEKSLKALMDLLRSLGEHGDLEPGQMKASVKAVRKMRHATRVGDRKRFEKAVGDFARVFVRISFDQSDEKIES